MASMSAWAGGPWFSGDFTIGQESHGGLFSRGFAFSLHTTNESVEIDTSAK